MNTRTPVDLTGWCTIATAAEAYHKSPETIRRWTRTYPDRLRSRSVLGTRYIHEADLDALAATHPPGEPDRAACAEAGHLPAIPDDGDLDHWVSLSTAARAVERSKATIIRWSDDGDVTSTRCACGRRRYVLEAELDQAKRRNERNRINAT